MATDRLPGEPEVGGVSPAGRVDLKVSPVMAPIRAQVHANIRQAIIELRFAPGQRLIERELIEMTGASRTSVREALRELTAEGLVTTVPPNRTIVAVPTLSEAEEIYEIRGLLEAAVIGRFVEGATDEEISHLDDAIARYADAREVVDRLEAKDDFYEVLGQHSPTIHQVLKSLYARIAMMRTLSLSVPGRHDQSVQEMRELVQAVMHRDKESAQAVCINHAARAKEVGLQALRTASTQQL